MNFDWMVNSIIHQDSLVTLNCKITAFIWDWDVLCVEMLLSEQRLRWVSTLTCFVFS